MLAPEEATVELTGLAKINERHVKMILKQIEHDFSAAERHFEKTKNHARTVKRHQARGEELRHLVIDLWEMTRREVGRLESELTSRPARLRPGHPDYKFRPGAPRFHRPKVVI